jgi:cytochrome c oxidase subunit IV
MSAVTEHDTEHADHIEHEEHGEHAHGTKYYVVIALILAAITALETSTYWIDFGPLFMPLLIGLMVIKFFMVLLFFMHLKDDAKMFSWLFYAGLGLAVLVYLAALLTFRFFE